MRNGAWVAFLLIALIVITVVTLSYEEPQPTDWKPEHLTLQVDDKGVNDG